MVDLNKCYDMAVSEIVGLASQLATQNCLSSYSKLNNPIYNLSSNFHAKIAT